MEDVGSPAQVPRSNGYRRAPLQAAEAERTLKPPSTGRGSAKCQNIDTGGLLSPEIQWTSRLPVRVEEASSRGYQTTRRWRFRWSQRPSWLSHRGGVAKPFYDTCRPETDGVTCPTPLPCWDFPTPEFLFCLLRFTP